MHHRVDIKSRRKNDDYKIRLRRSLRSGWYLYLLFYPWRLIPKRFLYTLWIQIKTKVFKGDSRALLAILGAVFDVLFNLRRLILDRNALNNSEYQKYKGLADTFLYWTN